MEIKLIKSIEEIKKIGDSYTSFLRIIGGLYEEYYSLEYLEASDKTFKALGASPFFILVLEENEIVAVFPFQLTKNRCFKLQSIISFWGELPIYAHNNFHKILISGHDSALIDQVVSYLKTEVFGKWDLLEFNYVKLLDENINYFISKFELISKSEFPHKAYYASFEKSTVETVIGSKKASNIRRLKKKLDKDFSSVTASMKVHVGDKEFNEIKGIHSQRQKDANSQGYDRELFFEDPLQECYLRTLFKAWSDKGTVRYYSLQIDERLAAVVLFNHSKDVAYNLITAIDTEYSRYGPGRVLYYDSFKSELDQFGIQKIEMGWGSNKLKEDYSTDEDTLYNVQIRSPRLSSRALYFFCEAAKWVKSHLARVKS